ncbi:hypothetical protein E3N88_18684 [Mikania micrantha]|uniref:Reverse transcriptase domain-containing protein n=1 Tax=Mikania micrantha TaxID=192012 RepID=A0A5N6NNV8_9ASTR|nr:hypothetical protein E3N88_18684 [Mikania micrantha]
MDTRSSSELKKALDNPEAEKREIADQMKKLQEHIRDLTITHRRNHDESSTRSAEDYSRDFEHLLMKCDLPEDDPQTPVRHLGGLEPRIAHVVELHLYSTLEELTMLTHKVDLQQKTRVFPAEIPAGLPPMRLIQHKIDLIPGNKPAYRTKQTLEIQKHVEDLLSKGLIRESVSPCAVPTLLVPKKNGERRMCMDGRAINKITIKYRFPIPRLNDMLDELHGDEWKTAFKTKEGLYEWLVMPFGLSNAPSTFMRLMNHVLKPFLQRFIVVYFDDILVYSKDEVDHQQHLQQLFEVLHQERLYGNKENSIMDPMTELTKLPHFKWNDQAQRAFDELKRQLSTTLVLALPCFDIIFEVECDASGVGIGAVLTQQGRPIAYFSENFNDAKRRYSTYDKELYAIIRALSHWQHYLISKEFILHSDHEAVKYIQGQHKLQPRHAKWVEFLQMFNISIRHKSSKLNKGVDALSRKYLVFQTISHKILGFDLLKQGYVEDPNFGTIFDHCQYHPTKDFRLVDGYLFKSSRLCIAQQSVNVVLIREVHEGGLSGHFGVGCIEKPVKWPNELSGGVNL